MASEFHWGGNIIGWHVEPLDDDARRMVQERAETLKARGEKVEGADTPLASSPFPASVMKASAGMTAPGVIAQTMSALPVSEQGNIPAPDANAPNAAPAPRRRAPKAEG